MEDSAQGRLPSLPIRLLQVFFSPGEVFRALREKPAWVGAMVVVTALVGLSLVLIPADMWMEFSRNRMLESGQEIPQGFESSGGVVRIFSILGGVIVTPIMMFVLAGVVTFFFSFLMGDEGRYGQYLAVVTHASIISSVGALLLVPLKLVQGDPSLTLNLGTFLPFLDGGYLLRVLKMLDLFALWSYGVMAVGVSKIDPQRSFGLALGFFIVFAVAFALIFGALGG